MASYSQITNTEQQDNNKKSYKTMNTKNQNIGENYTSPLCTLLKVSNEGVLCSSFGGTVEKLGNSIEYIWGEEE